MLDLSADELSGRVDSGEVLWSWDLGFGEARHLRFLKRELTQPQAVRRLSLPEAVAEALPVGHRRRVRSAEIAHLWTLSRPFVWELAAKKVVASEQEGHTIWLLRESLERFLAERWTANTRPRAPRL